MVILNIIYSIVLVDGLFYQKLVLLKMRENRKEVLLWQWQNTEGAILGLLLNKYSFSRFSHLNEVY